MSAVLETCLWHGSDWIAWIDRSGDARPGQQRLVDIPLTVRFTGRPPADLSVVQKAGRTLLWRTRPDSLRRTEAGEVTGSARLRPAVAAYPLEGEVSDPSGRFQPRRFSLSAGTAAGHHIAVYRAPVDVSYQSAGGVQGRAVFDDGTPAAWALIELTVSPPLAGAMPFVTQADAAGEFRLALSRLPALTRDAPAPRYDATLQVRASAAAALAWRNDGRPVDPDLLPAVTVSGVTNLKITPGQVGRLNSAGSDDLVLQALPPGP